MDGGEPIQLTHSSDSVVEGAAFFPDGKRILYAVVRADQTKNIIEVISTLGGEPKVLIQGSNSRPRLSPDGRRIAYFDANQIPARLMTISSDGGRPRELPAWARMPDAVQVAAWTSDRRYLLSMVRNKPEAVDTGSFEWFALPVDGGNPVATGAGEALRAAGLPLGIPILMTGDRVLFLAGTTGRSNVWEIRLSLGSWRVQGVPHQLMFGTLSETPYSISGTGTLALTVGSYLHDFYLIPLSAATGQPTGVSRRLTQDGRVKSLLWYLGGDPGSVYFRVSTGAAQSVYAVDPDNWKQTFVADGLRLSAVSPDGRQVAYAVPEGDSYSIRVGGAGSSLAEARVLCKACGLPEGFSPDGRFLFYDPGAKDSKKKLTIRLLDVASGKDRPWLEHPTDSVFAGMSLGQDSGWLFVVLSTPGSPWSRRRYLLPWRGEEPVPQAEWIKIPLPDGTVEDRFGESMNREAEKDAGPPWRVFPTGNFFYFFEGSKLMAVRLDPKTASFSAHREVKFMPGSTVTLQPDDIWTVRGQGLVFSRFEGGSSVWLMKLPR